MASHGEILGVILAGGAASRMGGGDKGLADLGGQPMLAHVIARFRPQVARLILNANGDARRFETFGLEVIADAETGPSDFAGTTAGSGGPLAGIIAAMDWIARNNAAFAAIATVSTDVPFLPLDCVARLVQGRAERLERAVIAESGGQRHPTIGLWPFTLAESLRAALIRGDLSLNRFATAHDAIAVSFPFSESGGRSIDPFFNANTPEDLRAARAWLAGKP